MSDNPAKPIDYTPEPLTPGQRWRMQHGLVDRMVREGNQEDAAARNAPLRALEADRKARQPGNQS